MNLTDHRFIVAKRFDEILRDGICQTMVGHEGRFRSMASIKSLLVMIMVNAFIFSKILFA